MRLVLDTGILGQIVHPRRYAEVREWLGSVVGTHEVEFLAAAALW